MFLLLFLNKVMTLGKFIFQWFVYLITKFIPYLSPISGAQQCLRYSRFPHFNPHNNPVKVGQAEHVGLAQGHPVGFQSRAGIQTWILLIIADHSNHCIPLAPHTILTNLKMVSDNRW